MCFEFSTTSENHLHVIFQGHLHGSFFLTVLYTLFFQGALLEKFLKLRKNLKGVETKRQDLNR